MLTLRATSLNGVALTAPIEAAFGEAGGSIGRADDNDLVLPDAERHISRRHARVVCRAGSFELINQGSNPFDVNGAPLARGQSIGLTDGDQIRIGGYVMGVVLSPAMPDAAIGDPFARPAGAAAVPRTPATSQAPPQGRPSADPLGLGPSASGGDPFAAPVAPAVASSRVPLVPSRPGGIPEDFDPFADPLAPLPAETPAPLPGIDLALGQADTLGQDIDELFGLPKDAGNDPFAGTALSSNSGEAGTPAELSLDPLVAWGRAPTPPSAAPVPDHVTVLRGAFKPPPPVREQAARADAQPKSPSVVVPPPAGDIFLSWDDASSSVVAPPATAAEQGPATPPSGLVRGGSDGDAAAGRPAGVPPRSEPAQAPRAPPSLPAAASSAPDGTDPLVRALIAGLGAAAPPSLHLTPELMERIGAVFREAIQGTLDLLMARALTKGEMRAEVTRIAARDNNPLKFSPDVATALAHLLGERQSAAFLPPVAAMRDVFDDLRAHQFGFMAGLRAALADVLRRFDPATLEQRLMHKSVLDSVLPMNRRAKLWDRYEQLYRDIATEAEDDFHSLFGREFLRAYEEQVARLGQKGGDPP